MAFSDFRIELGGAVILNRALPSDYPCLAMDWSSGLQGWYGTPDAKVTLTERQASDGAHDVMDDMVLYATRTVTIGVAAFGDSRADVIAQQERIGELAGRNVTVRVADSKTDTYATGYVTAKWDGERNGVLPYQKGTVTVVCPDPRRQATNAELSVLLPAAASETAGLSYGSGRNGLVYPLDYGRGALDARNVCTVTNHGTSTAWPTIRVSRGMGDVELLATCAGKSSTLTLAGTCTTEVTIDCRTRTAATSRTDVTRRLTGAGALAVPAGETMRLALLSAGTGSVSVELRDTYI